MVAIPLAVLIESAVSFYLIREADLEADSLVHHSSQIVDAVGSGVDDLLDREAGIRQHLIIEGKTSEADLPLSTHSNPFERSQARMDALRAQLHFLRSEQQTMLTSGIERLTKGRRLALEAVAGSALLAIGGGILAIWLFSSGLTSAPIDWRKMPPV